jgi:hypothetical protein
MVGVRRSRKYRYPLSSSAKKQCSVTNSRNVTNDGNLAINNKQGEVIPLCNDHLIGTRGIKYDQSVSNAIFYGYIIGVILWIAIVVWFCLYAKADFIVWCILLLPVIIFIVGAYNSNKITYDVEDSVFQSDYLSLGLLIVIPLLTWITKDFPGDRNRMISILVLAVILSMLSMIDMWVTRKWISVVKHNKSILQTMSLVLIIYALYSYYLEKPTGVFNP